MSANLLETEASAPAKNLLSKISLPTAENPDEVKAVGIVAYANEFVVSNASDSAKAQEAISRIKAQIDTLDAKRKEFTKPLDQLKKNWMLFFGAPTSKYEDASKILSDKVLKFDAEQRKIQEDAQRKAEADARIERARLQAIADETERKAREEAAAKRKAADEAAAAGDAAAAAKLNAQATRVEEKAEAKIEQFTTRAATVVAPVIQTESVKAGGTSFRDNWKWRLKDLSKVNATFLMTVTNNDAIDGIVKSMKDKAGSVLGEGIEIYNERGLASRRAG